ncbi:hypothetical protein [Thermochromatium tepidum]|jgi:hypothetical protein|uniref:Uncharacterized protein n=1 Tax=Thermochromatium tepidum ATCC 43061 TaxID=316276 RepID=A0A6I6E366_THETI|nr:hypothetical protein [Thermochromatium tepidum]QGU33385.1 hypothetical protein E6P07_10625 [Thermochromatium tepidum ATCC 43061]
MANVLSKLSDSSPRSKTPPRRIAARVLGEHLVERRLDRAAALELTPTNQPVSRSLSQATSIRNLFAEFAGCLLAAREADQGSFE